MSSATRQVQLSGRSDGGRSCTCSTRLRRPRLRLSGQAGDRGRLRPRAGGRRGTSPVVNVTGFPPTTPPRSVASNTVADATLGPVRSHQPDGAATIAYVNSSTTGRTRASTTSASPRRSCSRTPPSRAGRRGRSPSGDATFSFAGNQARMTFACQLDGGAKEPCGSPKTYSGLAAGAHTFRVTGTDRWGTEDAHPGASARRRAAVAGRPRRRRGPRRRGQLPGRRERGSGRRRQGRRRRRLRGAPVRHDAGRGRQGRDGEAARRRGVRQAAARRERAARSRPACARRSRAAGFVSLKGVAAVPMGSTLDTRAGEVAVTAAVNGQRAREPPAGQARGAVPRGHLRDPPGAQDEEARRPRRRIPPRARARSARPAPSGRARQGPGEGRAGPLALDDRQGRLPHRRRRGDRDPGQGHLDVHHHGPLRRHDHRGRPRPRRRDRQAAPASAPSCAPGRAYIVRARLFAARKGRGG